MPIAKTEVHTDDIIRVSYQDSDMRNREIAPYFYNTKVYDVHGTLWVGATPLSSTDLAVHEIIEKAAPKWIDAKVVLTKHGDPRIAAVDKMGDRIPGSFLDPWGITHSQADMKLLEPIKILVDSKGRVV